MDVYTGNSLKEFIQENLNNGFKERFILKDLHNYMTSPNNRKAYCLYGLRRTGKTVMSLQEIRNLGDYDGTLYISCDENDSIHDIKKVVGEIPKCKAVFIDEATKAEDFIDTSAFLGDNYAARGIKVVLSGTDSLGFLLAKSNELYDRVEFLHTTCIPFKEYNHLLGKGINDYITYGGTLTDNTFYNKDQSDEYTNSAIVENIVHTLEHWGDGINYAYQVLRPVVDSGELPSFINKVIEYPTREFLADIINRDFKSHDLGSLCQLMKIHDIADPKAIKTKEMTERIRDFLGIRKHHSNLADEDSVNAITEYLQHLDVLYPIPKNSSLYENKKDEYIFTQVGMRYCQATKLAEALVSSNAFMGYMDKQKEKILDKLDGDIRGGILEDIVFSQLLRDFEAPRRQDRQCMVSKYRSLKGNEMDVIVMNFKKDTSLALEVKLSDKQTESQRKHLVNEGFCEEIEGKTGLPIVNKAVIYLGENGETGDGVLYINAEDFLKRSKEMTVALLSHPHITEFRQLDIILNDDTVKEVPEKKTDKKKKSKSR